MTKPQPFTVIVEGNIGSGKTTLLNHFQKLPGFCVFEEPVDKWRNCQGHNLLDLMYKDPLKWSLCFESYVQLTMLDLHTKRVAEHVKIMERSLFSAKYCFQENFKDQKLISDAEYAVLSEWFDFARETFQLRFDLIMYLRTDPQVVCQRIAARGRPEKNSISHSYLKSIHTLYEDWLLHKKFGRVPPVIIIDANQDLFQMVNEYCMCKKSIIEKAMVANPTK